MLTRSILLVGSVIRVVRSENAPAVAHAPTYDTSLQNNGDIVNEDPGARGP